MQKRIISLMAILTLICTMIPTVALGATKGAIASGGSISSVYVYTVDDSGDYTFTDGKKGSQKGHVTEVAAEEGDRIVIKGDQTTIYWCSNGASRKSTPSVTPNKTEGTIDWYGFTENTSTKIWIIEGEVISINEGIYEDRNLTYNFTVSHTMTYSSSVYNVVIGNITVALDPPQRLAEFEIGKEVIKTVEQGSYYTVFLTENGNVYSMGNNEYGQLGLGDTSNRTKPTKVDISGIKQIAVGSSHTLLLTNKGEVYAMGWNKSGQLGVGDTTDRTTPTKVNISGVEKIYEGSFHNFLLMESGEVYAMGQNSNGQLGLGDTTDRTTPTKIDLTNVKTIECGSFNSFLVTESGEVYAAGYNNYGQLGIGSTTNKTSLTKLSVTSVKEVEAGQYVTFLLTESGVVYAMGYNNYGQLGIGSTTNKTSPTKLSSVTGVTAIAGGGDHTLFLTESGLVYATGYNKEGQLGLGNTTNKTSATKITSISGIATIKTYGSSSFLLTEKGVVYAMGDNSKGGLGVGDTTNKTTPTKLDITGITDITGRLLLSNTGDAYSMGYNYYGELGWEDKELHVPTKIVIPLEVNTSLHIIPDYRDISDQIDESTFKYAFDKKAEKPMLSFDVYEGIYLEPNFNGEYRLRVYAKAKWGPDINRVYVFNVINAPNEPPLVELNKSEIAIAGAGSQSLFLNDNGEVYVMGSSSRGQLGLGDDTTAKTTPTKIGMTGIKDIAAGRSSTFLLNNEGEVYAMGYNNYGQLGLGDTTDRKSPAKISNISNIKKIAITDDAYHTLMLTEDGEVYAMGYNNYGQLGLGDTTDRTTPTKLNISNVKDIAVGNYNSLLLMESGEVYGMGNNSNYQLGLGDTTNRTIPTKASITGVKAISKGQNNSLFLKTNGYVYGVGSNSYGELGLGDTELVTTPTRLSISNIKDIVSCYKRNYLITNNGEVYGMGYNALGELGLGDVEDVKTPTKLSVSNIKTISLSTYNSMMLTENGEVYVMGQNTSGYLGLGDTIDRSIPTKIPGFSLIDNNYPKVSNLIITDEALDELESSYYAFVNQTALEVNNDDVPNELWVAFDIDVPSVFLAPTSNDTYYLYVKLDYKKAKDGELVYRDGESHTTILGPFEITTIKGKSDSYSYVTGDIEVMEGFNAEFNLVFVPSQNMTLGNTDSLFSNVFNEDKLDIQVLDEYGNDLGSNIKFIAAVYKNGVMVNDITSNYIFTKRDDGKTTDNVYILRVLMGADVMTREGGTYQIKFNGMKGLSVDGTNQFVTLNSHPFTIGVSMTEMMDVT